MIVSGPPGAGKSSLAIPLAQRLRLPLLRKDHIKETLHDHLPAHGEARDWSRSLGGAATTGSLAIILPPRCATRFRVSNKQPRLARC